MKKKNLEEDEYHTLKASLTIGSCAGLKKKAVIRFRLRTRRELQLL
jgi:hypothetical protein